MLPELRKDELAVMNYMTYGMDVDTNLINARFTAQMVDDSCALVRVPFDVFNLQLTEHKIESIERLNGRVCVVNRDGATVRFVRLF